MQLEIEKLKAENDRLKLENQGSRTGSQVSISSSPPPHAHSQASGAGPGLPQHSLNLTTSESTSLGTTASVRQGGSARTPPPRRGTVCSRTNPVCVFSVLASDMLLDDTGGEGGMRKEGRHVKVVVSLDEDSKWTEVKPCLKKTTSARHFSPAGVFQAVFPAFIINVPPQLPVQARFHYLGPWPSMKRGWRTRHHNQINDFNQSHSRLNL